MRTELVNLYHLARTALCNTFDDNGKRKSDSRYCRMLWASKEYAKLHPEVTETRAYKELDRALA